MTSPLASLSKLNPTQDLRGFSYFENFLISAVTTILAVRFYLEVTGYPQIGGNGLHIAHMLWGGLFVTAALLAEILFIDSKVKSFAAVAGGIGFGLFIDELGKFITSDNNYFFQPTVALIYLILVGLFFILRLVRTKMSVSKEEYLANALSVCQDGLTRGIDEEERVLIQNYLEKADSDLTAEELLKILKIKILSESDSLGFFESVKLRTRNVVEKLINSRKVQITVIVLVELSSFIYLIFGTVVVLYLLGFIPIPEDPDFNLKWEFANVGQFISSLIGAVLAVSGAALYRISKYKAFLLIKLQLLLSIFVVQFFNFWINQFSALSGLLFAIITLQIVNKILIRQKH